jgi:hypothetical protein
MDWSDDNDLTEGESVSVVTTTLRAREVELLLACSRDNELSESL